MLAQSTTAVHATASHEAGGSSPATSLIGGAGAKKGRGSVGQFSDILSQALKSSGQKSAEPAKPSEADAQKSLRKKATSAEPRSIGRGASGTDAEPPAASEVAHSAKRSRADMEAPTPVHEAHAGASAVARERRLGAISGEGPDTEAGLSRAADEKRRPREKRGSPADEALAAAGAGSKLMPTGLPATRLMGSASGQDANPSIDKKAERVSSEPKVSVLDLRRSGESRREAIKAEPKAEEAGKDAIREAKAPGSEQGREVYRELSLDTRGSGESGSTPKAASNAARGQDFQSMMAERMRDAWNGEIVQSAHIVLKDGDAGIIRLRLRPESLGNVKIELNLSENNISGRIIVESDEAKTAFEKNMNELSDAFKHGGFETATLQVSVGGGSGGGANAGAAREGPSGGPFFSERLRSAVGSGADPATAASAYAKRGGAVDILA